MGHQIREDSFVEADPPPMLQGLNKEKNLAERRDTKNGL